MSETTIAAPAPPTSSPGNGPPVEAAGPTSATTPGGRLRSSASFRARAPRTSTRRSPRRRRRSRSGRRCPAAKRGAILTRAAEAIESRVEDIAQDMTREMGKPLRESRLEAARAAQIFRFFAGEGWRPVGEMFEQSATGSTRVHAAATARGGRADHAVELPGGDPGLEGRAGARVRQHGRDEARAGRAADRSAPGPRARGGRASRRRVQRRDRPRERGRRAARGRPAGARDLVHRLGAGRPGCPRSRRVARQARPARARRPQPSDRRRGREARRRRAGGVRRRVLVGRVRSARRHAGSTSRTRSTTTFRERLLARIGEGKVGDPTDPDTEVGPIVNETQFESVLDGHRARTRGRRHRRWPAASAPIRTPT